MPFVTRELPQGSGRYRVVNEAREPHTREAPQFECAFCERVIGKKRSVVLLDDGRISCIGCDMKHELPRRAFGSRAAIAHRLGIWPGSPDAAKVRFRQWLKQFTGDESAIGDLARDVYADQCWPRGPDSLEKYAIYFFDRGASDAALTALNDAWQRYTLARQGES